MAVPQAHFLVVVPSAACGGQHVSDRGRAATRRGISARAGEGRRVTRGVRTLVERVGQVVDFGAVSRKGPCWMFGRAVPPAVSLFAGGRLPVTAPGDAPGDGSP